MNYKIALILLITLYFIPVSVQATKYEQNNFDISKKLNFDNKSKSQYDIMLHNIETLKPLESDLEVKFKKYPDNAINILEYINEIIIKK